MIIILGDSNYRNTMDTHKEELTNQVGEDIQFKMVTSNESLKATFDAGFDPAPKIIMVAPPINEFVHKLQRNKTKGRDETIKQVLELYCQLVDQHANKNEKIIHVLIPPIARTDPKWIVTKGRMMKFFINDSFNTYSPGNVVIGKDINIDVTQHLGTDGVHLNVEGKKLLFENLKECLPVLQRDARRFETGGWDEDEEMESSQFSLPEKKTPGAKRKRTSDVTEEDDSEDEPATNKKSKGSNDQILDRLDIMMREMREDRETSKAKVIAIEQQVQQTTKQQAEFGVEMANIKTYLEKKEHLIANMKEEMDGFENENLRDTVVVRKLRSDTDVPTTKQELATFVQTKAREAVKEIGGEECEKGIKFILPMISSDLKKKDGNEKVLPPFKIVFRSKEVANSFKEKGIAKSKIAGEKYTKVYFGNMQCSATRIRVQLLWAIADKVKTDHIDSWVNMGNNKPCLMVKENGKIKSLTYSNAVATYGDKIDPKVIETTTKIGKKMFAGNLKDIFIVLKDN
jgi:hypothetical protein